MVQGTRDPLSKLRVIDKPCIGQRGTFGYLLLFVLVFSTCWGEAEGSGAMTDGKLAPCPGSPNCVSTQSTDPGHGMDPLPYMGTRQESRETIFQIVRQMKRSSIVRETDSSLHLEFRSALFGFVDDVDFLFDDGTRLLHFRSASRVGYYDFGVNRKRMRLISEEYLKLLHKNGR